LLLGELELYSYNNYHYEAICRSNQANEREERGVAVIVCVVSEKMDEKICNSGKFSGQRTRLKILKL